MGRRQKKQFYFRNGTDGDSRTVYMGNEGTMDGLCFLFLHKIPITRGAGDRKSQPLTSLYQDFNVSKYLFRHVMTDIVL